MVHTGPVPRRSASLLVATGAAALLLACSSTDGRTLPPPASHQTSTSVGAPVVAQPSEDDAAVEVFSLTSPAFSDGERIPIRHTCFGDGLSPPLRWTPPPEAVELALVVRDRDAAGFLHWVVTGIDPVAQGFAEGSLPEGAAEALNSAGTRGWTPPCPPAGSGTHTYAFVLHALPVLLGVEPGRPGAEVAELVERTSTETASLTGAVTAEG
jgi:Raf kinase inhibitor-like YbhB/YbcL family protein